MHRVQAGKGEEIPRIFTALPDAGRMSSNGAVHPGRGLFENVRFAKGAVRGNILFPENGFDFPRPVHIFLLRRLRRMPAIHGEG